MSIPSFKCVVFGGGSVGKSSIILRFVTDTFTEDYLSTIEDHYRKLFTLDGSPAHLEILDTAGQEEFSSARDGWAREGEAFILVYSITSQSSLMEVKEHYETIRLVHENYDIPIVLVGNKSDLAHERRVSYQEGEKLAKELGAPFIETSALEGTNCDAPFMEITRMLIRKQQASKRKANEKQENKKKWSCTIL